MIPGRRRPARNHHIRHGRLDLRGPLRLGCPPRADLPACQRISPGIGAYAEGAAG